MPTSPPSNNPQRNDDPRKSLDDLISRSIAYHSAPELTELLAFIRKFPYLAPYNAMLLKTQNPGIRYALRAPMWEQLYRRKISPGARPYVILRTMGPVEFVFDLSDTEPENPYDDRVPVAISNPFRANGVSPPKTFQKIIDYCLSLSAEVVEQDFGTILAGEIIRDEKRIHRYRILLNSKHSEARKIGTLIHELAHLLCGHLGADRENKIPGRTGLTKDIEEFEAEAVAYLVTDRLGIEIDSAGYLSGYLSSEKPIPEYSLDMVLKIAGKIEMMILGGKRPKLESFFEKSTPVSGGHEPKNDGAPHIEEMHAGLWFDLPGVTFKNRHELLPTDVWGDFLESTKLASEDGAYKIDFALYAGDAPIMEVMDRMIAPTKELLRDAYEEGVADGLDAFVFTGALRNYGERYPVAFELFSYENFLWKITVFSNSKRNALAELQRMNSTLLICAEGGLRGTLINE